MEQLWSMWWRLGGLAAILFVAVFIVGVGLQNAPPLFDDPIEEVRADWVNDGQLYLVADYVLGLAFVFFYVPFIVALRGLLGWAEGSVEMWSRVSFVGAFAFLIWSASAGVFWGTLAYGDFAETASDETLRTLMALDYYATAGMPFTWVVFVGATSLVVWRTRILWSWLVYLGLVEVVLAVIAPLEILTEGSESLLDFVYLLAFFGIVLWILCVGIAMLTRKELPPEPQR